MSSRSHHRSSAHSAARPRSTASAPSSYFSAFTSSPYGSTGKPRAGSSFYSTGTSAYKRSSRPGYFARIYEKVRKLIRDFVRYARKNPLKIIVPLVMALMGGGAIVGLVKRMGGLNALGLGSVGGMLKGVPLDSWIGASHGARRGYEGFAGVGQEQGFDAMGVAKGAVKIASAFL